MNSVSLIFCLLHNPKIGNYYADVGIVPVSWNFFFIPSLSDNGGRAGFIPEAFLAL